MQRKWIRFERTGQIGFGTLEGDTVHEHGGDMFGRPESMGRRFPLAEVRLLEGIGTLSNRFGPSR